MGWTSYRYIETNHKNFNSANAYALCNLEFNKNNFEIEKFYFQKSRTILENHVCYLVISNPDNVKFILVVLIKIDNEEIYFKEVPASFGPTEDKCPVEFLNLIKLPEPTSHEYEWFIRVLKNKVKFKKQILIF